MAKSKLVIDTPSNCYNCPLVYDSYCCLITGSNFFDKENFNCDKEILDDCPLQKVGEENGQKINQDIIIINHKIK